MSDKLISFDEAEKDLLAAATYLAERVKSRDGHAEAVAAVVPYYLKRGDVDLAAALADAVDDPFSRDRILISVAEKCAELDDDEYASQLAEAIEDPGLQSQAFERVALQKSAKAQFEKAREIAGRLAHPDTVLGGIAIKQSAMGDDAAAMQTLSEIAFPGTKVSAIVEIVSLKIDDGKRDEAIQFLETAVVESVSIEHNEERIRALTDIGNLFNQAARNDRAIEVFHKARSEAEVLDNVHRDGFLANVSLGFLRSGSLDLADRTLDLVADKTQMATALLGYAREFWKKDEKSEALDALEEAYAVLKSQREIETRSSRERFQLFTSITAQFAAFEKAERAVGIAQEIEDENEQASALTQIAQILTIRKEDEHARQALLAIPEDASRVFALIAMSDAKERNGERDMAIALLDEAAALAETVPQLPARSSAYAEIAKRYSEFGEASKAAETSRENLETIVAIRDESSQASTLANLSEITDSDFVRSNGENVVGLLRRTH